MKKRILVSAYFARNTGDDLFLRILFDRYPNVQWDLLTANRDYNKIFERYKNVNIIYTYRDFALGKHTFNLFYKISDLFFGFRKYDAIVVIGGSIFMQSPAWFMKFSEREYLLNKFKDLKKKAFILGANFGPFEDTEFSNKYKELLSRYDDICFRDQYSYDLFKGIGNVRLAPDIVFSMDAQLPDIKEKSVGFSIIDIEKRNTLKQYYGEYNQKIIKLAEQYIELGYRVKFFSFCENEGDLRIARSIQNVIASKKPNSVEVINYEGDIDDFLQKFKSCEVIIGSRFHSVILAILFGQSVFPIIYSDKTYNMLKDLDMADNCCYIKDLHNIDTENIISNSLHNKIKNRDIFQEAEKQFEKLDLFVG